MTTATMRLIEAVERLNMSGEIGDGMVATLHDLASMARLEVGPHVGFLEYANKQMRHPEPLQVPSLDDLVTLSPDTLAALKSRAERAPRRGGPIANSIQVLEREGPESFRPATQVVVADGGRCRSCGCPR